MTSLSLGSSLSGLLAEPALGTGAGPLQVSVSLLREDPAQPRDDLDTPDAQAALAELAGTIRARGVLQPITVCPPDATGLYVIRYGHRRYRASKIAGLDTVPVIIREADGDETAQLVDQILENEQREPLSPSQLARSVKRLKDSGMMLKDIAKALGKPNSQISYLMAITDLPPILAPLADTLGARTVAELKAAHDLDPEATARFIAQNPPEAITQVSARALAQAVKAPPAPKAAPPSAELETPAPAPAAAAEAPSPLPGPEASPNASSAPAGLAKGPKGAAEAGVSPPPHFAQAKRDEESGLMPPHLAALTRLFDLAASDTGQAGRVARFLMACWDAPEHGGFDVAELFALDVAISRDIAAVVAWFAEQSAPVYFDALGFGDEIQAVLNRWKPAA